MKRLAMRAHQPQVLALAGQIKTNQQVDITNMRHLLTQAQALPN